MFERKNLFLQNKPWLNQAVCDIMFDQFGLLMSVINFLNVKKKKENEQRVLTNWSIEDHIENKSKKKKKDKN